MKISKPQMVTLLAGGILLLYYLSEIHDLQ